MMVRTVFKMMVRAKTGFLGDLAQRQGRLIVLARKLGDFEAVQPYRLTDERIQVKAALPELQDPPHLGRAGGERRTRALARAHQIAFRCGDGSAREPRARQSPK